ncbi:HAMP domain-containing histidine kinase [Polyangium jinanense]|uniref:histidine kinase n=2 Tax=Polyangium jinanense TaxID=2829994 RepID=A0A9X3X0Z0_9BACT|nr:HAMP domain-containing sensor histidine kinase [Polyangium jinanense]MDC3953952.1 HAMP domain-containing histidine kinase [Polyangium jinanense]MDC3957835.1 HAMP domain-containing histidine kinase [Polyangium jinanense]MDC3978921.1 HAMP domain-containing histidine kinase [Polyangium jinanense]MDC3982092.1 HAMP domain-containing histidine kinase [Polyangium jinanense]
MDRDIRASVGADFCALALIDAEMAELRFLGDRIEDTEPLVATFQAGTASFLSTPHAIAERFPPAVASTPRALAVLPISAGGRRLGAVAFGYHDERTFASHERALFDDVTRQLGIALDRARLYEEANQARRRAEQSDRAKDEFLAMLGHELRNPLSPIVTALELLQMRGASGAEKEVTVIKRQVRHLVSLVDDLLDVSRITRGMVELSREPIELSEVVGRAVEMVSPLLEQRAHRLTLTVPREGLAVHGDPRRLAQVVSNLLTNAAKYTEPGGRIVVTASREDADVVLRVKDSGIGIAKEMLAQVFDLFTQEKQALDRSQGGLGLGLGLAIVRSMVTLHGGSVTAHSDGKDKGSEFVVRLPVHGAHVPEALALRANAAGVCSDVSW